MDTQPITIVFPKIIYDRVKKVANQEHRSFGKQVLYGIEKCLEDWEDE